MSTAAGEPAKKKRRTDEASGRSFARYTHDEGMRNVVPGASFPLSLYSCAALTGAMSAEILPRGWENEDWSSNIPARSSLPRTFLSLSPSSGTSPKGFAVTWHNIKTDLSTSHDPDYDSDEDSAWSYDLLRASSSPCSTPH